jgi:tRNA pseudouridine synthase 10
MEILEKAQRMLMRYPLCDYCLGRQFAMLGYGMENDERGRIIKALLTMRGHQLALQKDEGGVKLLKALASNGSFEMAGEILKKLKRRAKKASTCYLCEDHFKALPRVVEKILETLKEYEYGSLLVGVSLPAEVEEREDEFKAEFEVQHSESMRNAFSRVVGKMITEVTKKPVNYTNPEVTILVNPFTTEFEIQANPLYIMGRYKKLVRGIPQSKWICMRCRGWGCQRCNWTGKMYPESVEELIAAPVLRATLGEDTAFHSAGREDIDALMLGSGRPFIIEVKKPKKRLINLKELERLINEEAEGKIEVSNLCFVGKSMVRRLKQLEGAEKVYRVLVEFDREVSDEELKAIEEAFTKTVIRQRTPLRVLHRRADRTREKYIYETKVKRLARNRAEIRIRCQGGLYVKELVTGDNGRTNPNISSLIEAKAVPKELDVLNIIVKGGQDGEV